MKPKIGNWIVPLLILADQFLFWSIYYWNVSAISDEKFWYVFALLLCNRIALAWVGIFISSLCDFEFNKFNKWLIGIYLVLIIAHTIWFGISTL